MNIIKETFTNIIIIVLLFISPAVGELSDFTIKADIDGNGIKESIKINFMPNETGGDITFSGTGWTTTLKDGAEIDSIFCRKYSHNEIQKDMIICRMKGDNNFGWRYGFLFHSGDMVLVTEPDGKPTGKLDEFIMDTIFVLHCFEFPSPVKDQQPLRPKFYLIQLCDSTLDIFDFTWSYGIKGKDQMNRTIMYLRKIFDLWKYSRIECKDVDCKYVCDSYMDAINYEMTDLLDRFGR